MKWELNMAGVFKELFLYIWSIFTWSCWALGRTKWSLCKQRSVNWWKLSLNNRFALVQFDEGDTMELTRSFSDSLSEINNFINLTKSFTTPVIKNWFLMKLLTAIEGICCLIYQLWCTPSHFFSQHECCRHIRERNTTICQFSWCYSNAINVWLFIVTI